MCATSFATNVYIGEVELSSTNSAGDLWQLVVELDVDAGASDATWSVTASVGEGWEVTGTTRKEVGPGTELETSFSLRSDSAESELVLQLEASHQAGLYYGDSKRRYFDVAAGVATQLPPDVAIARRVDLDSGSLTQTPAFVQVLTDYSGPTTSLSAESADDPAMSAMSMSRYYRSVNGYISFWNSRTKQSDAPGSRHPECVPALTTCSPASYNDDCCWIGLHRLKVELRDFFTQQVLSFIYTDHAGKFSLRDENWTPGRWYLLTVVFESSHYPYGPPLRLYTDATSTTPISVGAAVFNLDGSRDTALGDIRLTAAGDTTSYVGDLASVFQSAYDTITALFLEGEEDRMERKYTSPVGASDPIEIRYYDTPDGHHCGDSQVKIDLGHARSDEVVRQLGYIYHGRTVGCDTYDTGAEPVFPQSIGWGDRATTGEGNALAYAIPKILLLVRFWDADIARSADLFADFYSCDYTQYNNTNMLSSERNNFLAIWELLDTSTLDAASKLNDQDLVDADLSTLMQSLAVWNVNGDGTDNYQKDEMYLSYESSGCFTSEQCNQGSICHLGHCYGGDPHGTNLNDWIQWIQLADEIDGPPRPEVWEYTDTIESSFCSDIAWNFYPYWGGFHTD